MSSNYEWQRQYTNERIQDRLKEAQSHRLARQGDGREQGRSPSRRPHFLIAVALLLALAITVARPQAAVIGDGPTRTTFPSAEDPGAPFYARIDPEPPYILDDGEWAAVIFYRDPGCVPPDFNLLSFFDPPAAFACPLTIHGALLWEGEPQIGAPKIALSSGNGAVPVWFVPVGAVQQAMQDGVLTIGELAGLEGRLVGYADQFNEVLHPHPLPPELGGGGHPSPKLIVNAQGQLDDGRSFSLNVTRIEMEIQAIGIQFS